MTSISSRVRGIDVGQQAFDEDVCDIVLGVYSGVLSVWHGSGLHYPVRQETRIGL